MDILSRIENAMNGSKDKSLTCRDRVEIKGNIAIYFLWDTPLVVRDKASDKHFINLSSNMDEGNYYRYGRTNYPPISHTTKERLNGLENAGLTQYKWRLFEGYPMTKEAKDRALETDCWYEVTKEGLKQLQPQLKIEGLIL